MNTAVSTVTFPPLSTPLPLVHTGWPVLLIIAASLVAAWIVCVLVVAAGVGLGHLLVLALRALVTTFRDHNPATTATQSESSAAGAGQRTNDETPPA